MTKLDNFFSIPSNNEFTFNKIKPEIILCSKKNYILFYTKSFIEPVDYLNRALNKLSEDNYFLVNDKFKYYSLSGDTLSDQSNIVESLKSFNGLETLKIIYINSLLIDKVMINIFTTLKDKLTDMSFKESEFIENSLSLLRSESININPLVYYKMVDGLKAYKAKKYYYDFYNYGDKVPTKMNLMDILDKTVWINY